MKTPDPVNLVPPNEGVHTWIITAAWECRAAGMSEAEALTSIQGTEWMLRKGRNFQKGEIANAIHSAYTRESGEKKQQRPKESPGLAKALDAHPVPLEELEERSPYKGPKSLPAIAAIDMLFPCNPLLCMARKQMNAITAPRDTFLKKEHCYPFIVPSIANAVIGTNKQGKASKRCDSLFPERTYAAVEFDNGTLDQQVARILSLAEYLPLVCVTFSGSKSLHSWHNPEIVTPGEVDKFYEIAIRHGADPHSEVRCQLMRTPGAFRSLGVRQTIHYFDPRQTRGPAVAEDEGKAVLIETELRKFE